MYCVVIFILYSNTDVSVIFLQKSHCGVIVKSYDQESLKCVLFLVTAHWVCMYVLYGDAYIMLPRGFMSPLLSVLT